MTGVIGVDTMTPVIKTQIYFPDDDLHALHRMAKRTGKSVAALVREAVRQVWIRPTPIGPVGIWDGASKRGSADHDSIYDEP